MKLNGEGKYMKGNMMQNALIPFNVEMERKKVVKVWNNESKRVET